MFNVFLSKYSSAIDKPLLVVGVTPVSIFIALSGILRVGVLGLTRGGVTFFFFFSTGEVVALVIFISNT